MTALIRKGLTVGAMASFVAFAAACSPDQSPTGPMDPQFVIEPDPASAWVCKIGPEGTSADFELDVDGPYGELPLGTEFTIDAHPECVWGVNTFTIWVAEEPRPDPLVNTTLTVTEVGATEGLELVMIDYAEYMTGTYSLAYSPETSASIDVNFDYGGRFKFTNEGEPPTGVEGCTPGYWRQEQHFDSWPADHQPGDAFSSVFDDAFPGQSLLDAVTLRGGHLNALGRHAVAAFLNASTEVDYGMTPSEVVDAFNDAYASGDYEETKIVFEELNEAGCPLN